MFPSVGGDPSPAPQATPIRNTAPVGSTGATLTSTRSGGNGRMRWMGAGVATLLVVALVAGAFVVFGARPGTPSLVAHYAPANVAAYAELRYDMPGDQHDQLASFMSHFPGFADTASFDQKVEETLENALAQTDTGLSWKDDIEPWFGGQVGVFSASLAPTQGTPSSFTLVMSVKDRAKLDSIVAGHTNDMQQETYKGNVIWSGTAAGSEKPVHFAVTDDAFVLSARNEDLKAALDTKAGEVSGLADDSFFTTQLGALHSDRLALVYFDHAALMDSMTSGTSPMAGCMTGLEGAGNVKTLGEVRAESDHLAFNVRSQYPSGENLPAPPANRNTNLAASMPANTAAYVEFRDAGTDLNFVITQLMTCLDEANSQDPGALGGSGFDVSQLERLLGVAPGDYFDFVQDAGVAITLADARFGGGVVATVDDENVARTRVERILSLARLAGGLGNDVGVTVTDEQHGDVTITTITIPPGSSTLPGEQGPSGPTSIGVAVANGRLYFGLDDFVGKALDQTAADSLASSPRLKSALAEAGTDNAGIVYADLSALRGYIATEMPAGEQGDYDTAVRLYLEPLDTVVFVSRNDNGISAGHGFLYVE